MHAPTPSILTPNLLIRAYSAGIFPMAEHRESDDVFWVEPRRRGVLPLDQMHIPRSLAKVIRQDRFTITADRCFREVMEACAEPQPGREQTWINGAILEAYTELHQRGYAHSIECWHEDRLAGGLYGVSLGGAFFGESMFSRATDASKVALVHLVARLRAGGYRLLDTQFLTSHLARFGTIEISRAEYAKRLRAALETPADFFAIEAYGRGPASKVGETAAGAASSAGSDGVVSGADFGLGAGAAATVVPGPLSGKVILQFLTETS